MRCLTCGLELRPKTPEQEPYIRELLDQYREATESAEAMAHQQSVKSREIMANLDAGGTVQTGKHTVHIQTEQRGGRLIRHLVINRNIVFTDEDTVQ